MKTKSIFSALVISFLFSTTVFAGNGDHPRTDADSKNYAVKQTNNQTTLDKIQQETEEISILKPVLSLAKMVEVKIEQNKQKKLNMESKYLNH